MRDGGAGGVAERREREQVGGCRQILRAQSQQTDGDEGADE